MITLFENKKDCCGCGACESVCPKNAISFKNDEYGFAYPEIDSSLCVKCGACKNACAYQNKDKENTPIKSYGVALKDNEKIMLSTSGGAFAALAREVLAQGGVVFGAVMERNGAPFTVHHTAVDNEGDLQKILKSKYVHSQTLDCYKQAKSLLDEGRLVLYSGTPCQIAGLKGYLKKDYENLVTVDLVCHGVPSIKLFNDYIRCVQERKGIEVTGFDFRDKSNGWSSQNRRIHFIDKDGTEKSKSIDANSIDYSYMHYFKFLLLLRENCYFCKYAGANRPADISLGDFWGFKRLFPDEFENDKNNFSYEKGISCVLLNTRKGIDFFENTLDKFNYRLSCFDDVAAYNAQLRAPSKMPDERAEVLELYKSNGYEALEKRYAKVISKKKAKNSIKKIIPKSLLKAIKG